MALTYVSQNGAGSQTGADAANAINSATFQAASYSAGDVIFLTGAWSYSGEGFTINDAGITITGDAVITQNSAANITTLRITSDNVTFGDVEINGTSGAALTITNASNTTIHRSKFNIKNNKAIIYESTTSAAKSGLLMYLNEFDSLFPEDASGGDDFIMFQGDKGSLSGIVGRNNLFKNAGHSAVNGPFHWTSSVMSISDILFYDNEFDNDGSPYGRAFDFKANASNYYTFRNKIKGMRSPSQFGGDYGYSYNNLTINHRTYCSVIGENGCTALASDPADTYHGSGQTYQLTYQESLNGHFMFAHNTVIGADGPFLSSAEPCASLALYNNIAHDVNRNPSQSQDTKNRYAVWIQDAGAAYADVRNNNFYDASQSALWSEGESGTAYNITQVNAATPSVISAASGNVSLDQQLDAKGAPTIPVAAYDVPALTASILPSDGNIQDAMSTAWTWQTGGSVVRGGGIGAVVAQSAQGEDIQGWSKYGSPVNYGLSAIRCTGFDRQFVFETFTIPVINGDVVTVSAEFSELTSVDNRDVIWLINTGSAATLEKGVLDGTADQIVSAKATATEDGSLVLTVRLGTGATGLNSDASIVDNLVISTWQGATARSTGVLVSNAITMGTTLSNPTFIETGSGNADAEVDTNAGGPLDVVITDTPEPPTPSQVHAGQDSGGVPVDTGKFKTLAISQPSGTITFTGLPDYGDLFAHFSLNGSKVATAQLQRNRVAASTDDGSYMVMVKDGGVYTTA